MIAKSTSQHVANFNYLPYFSGPFFKTHWRLLQKETNVLLSKTWGRPAELHLGPRRQWWPGLAGSTTTSCWFWKLQRKPCQESAIKLHILNQGFSSKETLVTKHLARVFTIFLWSLTKTEMVKKGWQHCTPDLRTLIWNHEILVVIRYETMKSRLAEYPIHQPRKCAALYCP